MPAISRSAPGKIILCGEHAVVYHQPAIAIPLLQLSTTTKIFARPNLPKGEIFINAVAVNTAAEVNSLAINDPLRKTVELVKTYFALDHLPACEIQITSTLPVAAGLGSSASLSVSIIRALTDFIGHPLEDDQVNLLAYEAEKFHHGNPSGVDNTVIAYERPVFFQHGHLPEFLIIAAPFQFIIANTGIQGLTAQAVAGVKERWQKDSNRYDHLFSKIGDLTCQVREGLANGDPVSTGKLLTQNHALLSEMGLSCKELDWLVATALEAGASGAKLSGGGLGGNMLALVTAETSGRVTEALSRNGAKMTLNVTLPASVEK